MKDPVSLKLFLQDDNLGLLRRCPGTDRHIQMTPWKTVNEAEMPILAGHPDTVRISLTLTVRKQAKVAATSQASLTNSKVAMQFLQNSAIHHGRSNFLRKFSFVEFDFNLVL